MSPRAFLLAALLVSPAWSQERAAQAPAPAAPSFNLRSDAIKKIVADRAASQLTEEQVADQASKAAKPTQIVFVTPEKRPVHERPTPRLPDPSPKSNGFLSSMVEILAGEVLGIHD